MSEKRFPIQSGLSVTVPAAQRAYQTYVRFYGNGQSLERMAQRGGFGVMEFVMLWDGRAPGRDRQPDEHRIAFILSEADIRRVRSGDREFGSPEVAPCSR